MVLVGLSQARLDIAILLLHLLDVGEQLSNVLGLERHVLVVTEHILLSQKLLVHCLLTLLALCSSRLLSLNGLIQASNDGLYFIT